MPTVRRPRPSKPTPAKRATKAPARPRVARAPVPMPDVEGFQVAALLEYFANRSVSELQIVELADGGYRLEALLVWRPTRVVLLSARGGARRFRNIDRLVTFLKELGVGSTGIRMELRT
jgi:hypothetical protein